jgi:hypothetical protein
MVEPQLPDLPLEDLADRFDKEAGGNVEEKEKRRGRMPKLKHKRAKLAKRVSAPLAPAGDAPSDSSS